MTGGYLSRWLTLEPLLLADDVFGHELVVGLRQVHDPLDQADDTEGTARHYAKDKLDDRRLCKSQIEFVDAKVPNKMPKMPAGTFFSEPFICLTPESKFDTKTFRVDRLHFMTFEPT